MPLHIEGFIIARKWTYYYSMITTKLWRLRCVGAPLPGKAYVKKCLSVKKTLPTLYGTSIRVLHKQAGTWKAQATTALTKTPDRTFPPGSPPRLLTHRRTACCSLTPSRLLSSVATTHSSHSDHPRHVSPSLPASPWRLPASPFERQPPDEPHYVSG